MLKYIKQHAASIAGIEIYPLISMTIFVLFFVAVLYYVKKMDRKQVDQIRNMPLDGQEDEVVVANKLKQA